MTRSAVDTGVFTKPFDSMSKLSKSANTINSRDPRPALYNNADNEVIKAGRDYATQILGLAYPEINALNLVQKTELRNYAPDQQNRLESEAYNAVKDKNGIEAFVRESAKDKEKLSKIENLLGNEEFVEAGGIAKDNWRKSYFAYLELKKMSEDAIKKGPKGLDDESRAVFFGEAAAIYAEGIAKKIRDAKIYTNALVDAGRSAAYGSFLEGRAKKADYEAAVKNVVRKQKVKLVGAEDSINDAELEKEFNKIKNDKAVSLVIDGIEKHIRSPDTQKMRQGMGLLRQIL